MQQLPESLHALKEYNQFILWKLVEREGKKPLKLPVDYNTGVMGDAHDSNIWTDSETAILMANVHGPEYGIGFVFTGDDPFFFVDIDKCLEADGKTWSPLATELLGRFPGAAVEVSQSNAGLHIFGKGTPPAHCCKNIVLGIELYTEGRFVALTGTSAMGDANSDHTAALVSLVDDYFPAKGDDDGNTPSWTIEPVAEWNGIEDDDELIKKALTSGGASSVFGGKASFRDLWERNVEVLAAAYPDESREYDCSSADAALAQHLAFWTGNNCERILLLMKQSGLVRDKWEREKYLTTTVLNAVSLQKDFYTGNQHTDIKNKLDRLSNEISTITNKHISFDKYEIPTAGRLAGEEIPDALILLSSIFDNRLRIYNGCFYWYTGREWEPLEDSSVRKAIGFPLIDDNNKKVTQSRIKGTLEAMRDHALRLENLDPPLPNIYFLSGVLSIPSREFTHHSPENNNTRTLSVDYLQSNDCPQWTSWLAEIFQAEPKRADLLQEIMGWMLCRSNFGIEKAVLFIGPPRAGKGVILRIISFLLDRGAVPFSFAEMNDPKRLSALRTVNTAIDSDAVGPNNRDRRAVMGLFKRITSNESISVPQLYKQTPWEGPLNCKLLIAANSVPIMWDDSAATANRWIPLKFDRSFLGKEDTELFTRLSTEIAGIASWALEGLIRLVERGCFELPQSSRDQLDCLISDGGSVQHFIDECLQFGEQYRSKDADLYLSYRIWAEGNGHDLVKRCHFLKALEDALRGQGVRRAKSVKLDDGRFHRGFRGVDILPLKMP